MTTRTDLRGAFTALVTPFRRDGAVDEAAFERLVERQLEAGIDGLVPCGTTGESPTLTGDERDRLIELTIHAARQRTGDGRTSVVAGTGTEAAVPGYTVAGKTGTAQKPDGHGGYSSSKFVASFVGMVPASNPRLVVAVAVDEPSAAIWGGVVAAPAFAEIAKFDLQYLEVPPDAPERNVLSASTP